MTYHPKTVYHEQGSTKFVCSSGGEIEVLSGGLVDLKGKLELVSGAELEMESGSTMNVEAGAVVKISTGAKITNQNILSTGTTSLTNYGAIVVTTTKVRTLSAPEKGSVKHVIMQPTSGEKARIKTGSTLIFFNSSGQKKFCINVKAETSKAAAYTYGFTLFGNSTTQWWVHGINSIMSTATANLTHQGHTVTITKTSS